jgi:glycosyltransferase involved in cell wall biosynthesis
LPEAAGDAALLVDPPDAEALAGAMQRVLDDKPLAHRLGQAGAVRAQQFSWDRAAAQTAAVYRQLLETAALPK